MLESWIELVTELASDVHSIFLLRQTSLGPEEVVMGKKKKHIKVVIVTEECSCGLTKAYFLYKEWLK